MARRTKKSRPVSPSMIPHGSQQPVPAAPLPPTPGGWPAPAPPPAADWGNNGGWGNPPPNDSWGNTGWGQPPLPEEKWELTEEEEEALYEKSITPRGHYLVREQIYFAKKWRPWDRSTYVPPPPPKEDRDNYFYVNLRHWKAGDAPSTILSNFSDTLLSFLRKQYGNQFYNDNPEIMLTLIMQDIHVVKEHLTLARNASQLSDEKLREAGSTLGCMEAQQEDYPLEHIRQYLEILAEHLGVLHDYLDEEYKPIAERLALQLSYGHISFDLLCYYFQVGMELVSNWSADQAFVLESRQYGNTFPANFELKGYGYELTNRGYIKYPVSRIIPDFAGTMEIKDLSCKPITDEFKAKLTERGRLYAQYNGIHYKAYHGDRVIVDYAGFFSREGFGGRWDAPEEFDQEKLLYLLPPEVYGFNLTHKDWQQFFVTELSEINFDEKAWDHLVLDPETKDMIRALVSVNRTVNEVDEQIITDVIDGKGGGLLVALHGPPGTGKTLTAEAVAEHLKRPLYTVGSSELSTNPKTMEETLQGILSLATSWDAVVLIDEADVYLQQRSLHEIERNMLVSTALRLLEYHRGVLFLTTNRIQAFDPAFLSRFSIAIKYPELDEAARLSIWRKFFVLAGYAFERPSSGSGRASPTDAVMVFEQDANADLSRVSFSDLQELAKKPYNGRTIKNLVRTAQALALSANQPLSVTHVNTVVRTQEKFLREFALA